MITRTIGACNGDLRSRAEGLRRSGADSTPVGCWLLVALLAVATPGTSNGQVDLSTDFDLLDGQRKLLGISDLVVSSLNLQCYCSQEESRKGANKVCLNTDVNCSSAGFHEWDPGFYALPTEGGAISEVVSSQPGAALTGLAMGPPSQRFAWSRTVAARPFNVIQDYVVQIRGHGSAGPPFSSVSIELFEYDNGALDSIWGQEMSLGKMSVALDNPSSLDVIVADFDKDGLDDFLFTFGSEDRGDPYQYWIYTAVDRNEPSQGLAATSTGVWPGPHLGSSVHAIGDFNADNAVDIVKPLGCYQGSSDCSLSILSVCPGPSPIESSICDGKAAFDIVLASKSIELSLQLETCAVNADVDENCPIAVAAGEFVGGMDDGDQLFLATYDPPTQELSTDVYMFDSDLTPVPLQQVVTEYSPATFFNVTTAGHMAVFDRIDPFGFGDGAQGQVGLAWVDGQDLRVYILWLDPQASTLQVAEHVYKVGDNHPQILGLALGRFGDDIPPDCENGDSEDNTDCASVFDSDVAVLYGNTNGKAEVLIFDVLAGDDCTEINDAALCFATGDPHAQKIDLGNLANPEYSGLRYTVMGDGNLLLAPDLQGRGVLLGEPIVSRITQVQTSIVQATPPMHADQLRIEGFNETLFPTSDASTPKWFSQACVSGAGCACSASSYTSIDAQTTCMMNFSFQVGTGGQGANYNTEYTTASNETQSSEHTHSTSQTFSGSSSVDIVGQVSTGVPGVGASESVSAYSRNEVKVSGGYTNSQMTKSVTDRYMSTTWDTAQGTEGIDRVSYSVVTQNTYRYPMIGISCDPSGGNTGNCTTTSSGTQYYTVTAPDQPTTYPGANGDGLEWFQPVWEYGNILSYPSACSELQAMIGSGSTIEDVIATDPVALAPGSLALQWSQGNTNSSTTGNSSSGFTDDSYSRTVGVGCVSEPDGNGVRRTYTGDFHYNKDMATTSTSKTTTSGTQGITVNIPQKLFWSDPDPFDHPIQLIFYGQQNSSTADGSAEVFDPPFAPDDVDFLFSGHLATAFTTWPEGDWWGDVRKQNYTKYVDAAFNHPKRVIKFDGGTINTSGDPTTPPQCLINSTSKKLDCATFTVSSRNLKDLWGTGGDWDTMKGLFLSTVPQGETLPSINGFTSTGGTIDTVVAGDMVTVQLRVHNYSLTAMADRNVETVWVQIYGQEWDAEGQRRATDALGRPVPSFLLETFELPPIPGKADNQSSGCSQDPSWNWTVASTTWDTTDYGGSPAGAGQQYIFWAVTWLTDENGNLVEELPGHGLQAGGTADGHATACPDNLCTWMDDVVTDPYSNNLGFYKQVFTVLEADSSSSQAAAPPSIAAEHFSVDAPHRLYEPSGVHLLLHNAGGPTEAGVVVTFGHHPPVDGRMVGAVDQEIIGHMSGGQRHLVRVVHRPDECGQQTLFAEVRYQGGSFVESVEMNVPCDEQPYDSSSVRATALRRDGLQRSVQIVLEFEAVDDLDLASSELLLEEVLKSPWGDEPLRSSEGDSLGLTELVGARDAEPTRFSGRRGGSRVSVELKEHRGKLIAKLTFNDVMLDSKGVCDVEGRKWLMTRLSISDDSNGRVLLQGVSDWDCKKGALVPASASHRRAIGGRGPRLGVVDRD